MLASACLFQFCALSRPWDQPSAARRLKNLLFNDCAHSRDRNPNRFRTGNSHTNRPPAGRDRSRQPDRRSRRDHLVRPCAGYLACRSHDSSGGALGAILCRHTDGFGTVGAGVLRTDHDAVCRAGRHTRLCIGTLTGEAEVRTRIQAGLISTVAVVSVVSGDLTTTVITMPASDFGGPFLCITQFSSPNVQVFAQQFAEI